MERVLGVYVGILRMTVLLPFTLWRAWEITKSRECADINEDRDVGDYIFINESEESARFGIGVTFGETGGDWIEQKEDIEAGKPELVTKDMEKNDESQNKQIHHILDRINKLEQEVNVALLLTINYKCGIFHYTKKPLRFIQCHKR